MLGQIILPVPLGRSLGSIGMRFLRSAASYRTVTTGQAKCKKIINDAQLKCREEVGSVGFKGSLKGSFNGCYKGVGLGFGV